MLRAACWGVSGVVAGMSVLAGVATAKDASDPVEAVRAAYVACDEGWRKGSVREILDAYAPDFEWTNSIGLRFTSKIKLRKFLEGLFRESNYAAGRPGPLKFVSIRLLGDAVAVVSSSESTFGQKDYRNGKPVPEQRTNELTVLQRIGGRWLIVSDLTSDESHGI